MFQLLLPVALKNGYALAIHGSLQNDLDLIAAPWREWANKEKLLEDLVQAIGCAEDIKIRAGKVVKTGGRTSYVLFIAKGMYIDLSVF